MVGATFRAAALQNGAPGNLKHSHPVLDLGWAGFQLGGRGVDRVPWLGPPPQKGPIDGPPKILPILTPGARRWHGPEIRQKKMKMRFLESARRGGSEKSSFAMYLVGGGG